LTGDAEAAVTQAAGILPSVGTLAGQGPPVGGAPAGTFMDGIGGFFNSLMAGFLQIDQQNPITSMANIGTGLVRTSELVIGLTYVAPSGGTANGALAKAIGVAGAWAMGPARLLYPFLPDPGMVREVMFGFLLVGMALAYWVPMLPFIRFMFAVLGWFQEVVTVVILIPLMLTQMVSVEGQGLVPPIVKSCAWSILAAALRPMVTVIGFVVGILMATAWVALLNQAFLAGFRNSQNGETWGISGTFAYYAIYLFFVYVSMNTLFKMPEYVTHAMYRVLNANAGGERDDAGAVATAANALAQRFLPGLTRQRAAR
jgi:conjugal transfer/type IV secretion protein DotA/TraY